MTWETLAPWIAIAFTLALSILVPLFTQIANNSHQRKMQREKIEHEESQKKIQAYEAFLSDVGGSVTAANYTKREDFTQAGASIYKMYLYAPSAWWDNLDELSVCIKNFEWDKASVIAKKLSRMIAEDLKNKESIK